MRVLEIEREILGAFLSAGLDRLREHDDDGHFFAFMKYHVPKVIEVVKFWALFSC
jgi:hypothetical protein